VYYPGAENAKHVSVQEYLMETLKGEAPGAKE
jgi:hypothetical protein